MQIRAQAQNSHGEHRATVATDGTVQSVNIPPKPSGQGSSVNGGELLFLALATCFCNDIYREAPERGIPIERVEVEIEGHFGAAGEPATGVSYRAKVVAHAREDDIWALMQQTDQVAETQNAFRAETAVMLENVEALVDRS